MKIAVKVKTQFCRNLPSFIVGYQDEQLFPERNHCIERLLILVTSTNIEQLIAVPKLKCAIEKEQVLAVCNALTNIVDALCCNTTASNSTDVLIVLLYLLK